MALLAADDPLGRVSIAASEVAAVDPESVRTALHELGVVRLRGLFDPEEVRRDRQAVAARFDPAHDRAHDPADADAVRTNLQKLRRVGPGSAAAEGVPRIVRTLHNPIFEADVHGLRRRFVTLARLRNRVYGLEPDFAVHGTDDGFWTAARLHQYPRGGGHMAAHQDGASARAVDGLGVRYAQMFLVMSEHGVDFQAGGAFVEIAGEAVRYEVGCRPGDVIVYDGRTRHGVAEIDPHETLDLASFTGRVAAFASLWRHLTASPT